MTRYSYSGYYDTTTRDNRALRIVFLHDDPSREEADVNEAVMVLRDFADDITAGRPDVKGKTPSSNGRPCDVIVASHAGLHPSKSDPRAHLSVEVATLQNWNKDPKLVWSGLHVYSQNNVMTQGYAGWFKTKNAGTSKMTSSKVKADLETALQNDMRRPATPPKQPSPPRNPTPSPPRDPTPTNQPSPPSGAVGLMADNKTHVYWSNSKRQYYWLDSNGGKHGCDGPGSQFRNAGGSSGQASGSASTSASKTHQASASKKPSSSASSSKKPGEVGRTPDDQPYFYSAKKQQYYTVDSHGTRHNYNP